MKNLLIAISIWCVAVWGIAVTTPLSDTARSAKRTGSVTTARKSVKRSIKKKPCRVEVVVFLAKAPDNHMLCTTMFDIKRTDEGKPIKGKRIDGCTNGSVVVTDYNRDTLWHEFNHVWRRKCK